MRQNRLLMATVIASCTAAAIITSCATEEKKPQKLSYQLVATGQTECYDLEGKAISAPKVGDDLYGQDGNYKAGVPMSYKDNGNGTVTDLNTGLLWEQTPEAGGVTWVDALAYCENLELGGYTDWRLPTLKELFSISDFSTGWPYINKLYFNLTEVGSVSKDEQYWAAEKYVGETVEGRNNAAFGVNHGTGHIKAYPAGGASRGGNRGGESTGSQDRSHRQGAVGGADSTQRQQMRGLRGQQQEGQQQGARGQMGGERGQQQGERGERGQMGGERGQQQQGERPQMMGGDSTQRQQMMRQRGQGGDSTQMRQRPQMGGERGQQQGGRPQMAGGQAGGGQTMSNPMQKYVRAVRGSVYGENEFKDNNDGTISDKATGLMWAKSDNGEGIEWTEALKYAESSTLAGHKDWRLPNVKELQSIVDYSYSPSSSDPKPAINPLFSCTPFVNEAGDNDFGYYWTSTSALFRKGSPYYFAWYVAFGRAVNGSGKDMHGAGAVRFDSKSNNKMEVEGGEERYFNFVRLVRVE